MSVQEGKLYPAEIDGYASDGSGVARIQGVAVFVRGAIRGERVQVRVEHVGHSAAWARLEEVLTPSPHRVPPDCPYYHLCGGCQFRHMDHQEELAAKRAARKAKKEVVVVEEGQEVTKQVNEAELNRLRLERARALDEEKYKDERTRPLTDAEREEEEARLKQNSKKRQKRGK